MHVDSGCSASFLHTWKTQQSSTILALCVAARTSDGIWFEHRHFFLEWLVHSLLFMTFCNTLFAVYFCIATYFIDTFLMCVYLCSSTLKAPSVSKMSETYLRGTDQRCYVVSIIPGASAKFLHLHFWKCHTSPSKTKL